MNEEYYQDGIKLPTESDVAQWIQVAPGLWKVKIPEGHIYKVKGSDHLCFVPRKSVVHDL